MDRPPRPSAAAAPRRADRVAGPALLALALCATPAAARPRVPLQGDFAPTSERDIKRFCKEHNGLTGTLHIGPTWPHPDLAPLRCIETIGEALVIQAAPLLERLDGLDGIRGNRGVVLARVRIVENPYLHAIDGLAPTGLATQDLVVNGNPVLDHLDGGLHLVSGGTVRITANRRLGRVAGIDGAKAKVRLAGLTISNNAALRSIEGFAGVQQVDELTVSVNASLATLGGFSDLSAAGTLVVRGNPSLATWTAAGGLGAADALVIEDNDSLQRLPELPHLQRATLLHIADNDTLTDTSGIGGLGGSGGARAVRPSVDRLRIEANDRLDEAAAQALVGQLALSDHPDALTIRANGGALLPDAPTPSDP